MRLCRQKLLVWWWWWWWWCVVCMWCFFGGAGGWGGLLLALGAWTRLLQNPLLLSAIYFCCPPLPAAVNDAPALAAADAGIAMGVSGSAAALDAGSGVLSLLACLCFYSVALWLPLVLEATKPCIVRAASWHHCCLFVPQLLFAASAASCMLTCITCLPPAPTHPCSDAVHQRRTCCACCAAAGSSHGLGGGTEHHVCVGHQGGVGWGEVGSEESVCQCVGLGVGEWMW